MSRHKGPDDLFQCYKLGSDLKSRLLLGFGATAWFVDRVLSSKFKLWKICLHESMAQHTSSLTLHSHNSMALTSSVYNRVGQSRSKAAASRKLAFFAVARFEPRIMFYVAIPGLHKLTEVSLYLEAMAKNARMAAAAAAAATAPTPVVAPASVTPASLVV